jgi:transposase
MAATLCPACGGELHATERLQMVPEKRVYAGVSCKVVFDCPACARVYEQWLAPDAPLVEWTDPEMIALRARFLSRRGHATA